MHRASLILLVVLFSCSALLRALTIDSYTAATNDRFANAAGFIANNFNLSGIAISSGGQWATMIAPNVFITAWHFTPGIGQTLTFYETNNPNGPSVTRTVSSIRQRIGTSDLNLCTLNLPVPEGYAYYAFATENLPTRGSLSSYPYWNKELYHFGRSSGSYALSQDIGVGKNILDQRVLNQIIPDPAANGPAIECEQELSVGKVLYETLAQGGDSGAPLFYDQGNGIFKLIGISWYITTQPTTGFSPVGDYDDAIHDFLNLYALPYQPLAPGLFTGTRILAAQIDLTWNDNSEVESAFRIERAEAVDGPWTEIATLPADTESYSDPAAPEGDVYYRLQAENDTASDSVIASILTPYSQWAESFDWGVADQSPAGDANNDGLTNLAAYSMNLPPVDPVPSAALPHLETPSGFVVYYYRRNPDAVDISFTLKKCTELTNPDWQTVGIDGVNITESELGTVEGATLIRIRMPATPAPALDFFRLEINSSQLP